MILEVFADYIKPYGIRSLADWNLANFRLFMRWRILENVEQGVSELHIQKSDVL